MLRKVIFAITLVSLCLLGIMLATTTPATAGPFGLLLIFVTAYLSCLGLISFFLYGISRVIGYILPGRSSTVISFKKAYYYSTVLAAVPVMLLGLQSVGAVGIYELALLAVFVIIGIIYITKRFS